MAGGDTSVDLAALRRNIEDAIAELRDGDPKVAGIAAHSVDLLYAEIERLRSQNRQLRELAELALAGQDYADDSLLDVLARRLLWPGPRTGE